MSSFPSIFNDVIGPVMRGPSSSHCAASLRIARLCRDLMDENIKDKYCLAVGMVEDGAIEAFDDVSLNNETYPKKLFIV